MDELKPKTPPHSPIAEQSVLGAVLLESNAWDRLGRLDSSDFYHREHQLIWAAMQELARASQPLDVVTVSEKLEAMGAEDESGGLAYLAGLAQDSTGSAGIRSWADVIRENSTRRQIIAAGSGLIERGYAKEGMSAAELLDAAEREVLQIAENRQAGERVFRSASELIAPTIEAIQARADGKDTGLKTGLREFDRMTTGLHPGDLLILAGRPAMGKTSLAMNWAEHAALGGVGVGVFSMEMPAGQLMQRLISSNGRVNQQSLRTGRLSGDEWRRVNDAAGRVGKAPIYIDDTGGLSPNALRSKARRMKRQHNIGLLVVDYLQLMQVPGTKENRTTEITEISRNLKALAKELDIPVVALSQLNRGVEQRENKRPRMSDLRESGGIEQDADLIVFVYRDEVYNRDSIDKGVAEVIIAKQRNGEIGTSRAAFIGEFTRFDNLAEDWAGREAAA